MRVEVLEPVKSGLSDISRGIGSSIGALCEGTGMGGVGVAGRSCRGRLGSNILPVLGALGWSEGFERG